MNRVVLLLLSSFFLSCSEKKLFETKLGSETNISFVNQLIESEKENILTYEYFYNGGGVAAGDFNNDGKIDLYFTGNQVLNKLYLNSGNMKFEDISEKAGVEGRENAWATGVSVADVNADGWLDLYVCYSGVHKESERRNQLFINNGIDPNTNQISFTERAQEYGLDDSGYSTQATFFDYDLDGDLDCFLINHNLAGYERKEASVMRNAYSYDAGDKLFKNEITKNGTPFFSDVSEEAGIKGNPLGFGLGLSIADINDDGYPDIYVTNDYVEDDYLYINSKDGTFQDQLRDYLPHTSYSSMGVDIADINNDLKPDILTLDMLPEDNKKQKLLVWPDNWNVYKSQLENGFWHQNMRNMLQINEGNGKFSEIGQFAGVSATDWSWGCLLADFDLDGYKDIFISNGLAKDLTNIDFIKYFNSFQENEKSYLDIVKEMTSTESKNYIYRNDHNLQFENKQKEWGFDFPVISNGCIYADLDNDNDYEIITNNLNSSAQIFENTSNSLNRNTVKIHLKGEGKNIFGIGTTITVKDKANIQVQNISITHGFLSSKVEDAIFGITGTTYEVEVKWPNGNTEVKKTDKINSTINFNQSEAIIPTKSTVNSSPKSLFTLQNNQIDYKHTIKPRNDFDYQPLLPNQYSYYDSKAFVFGSDNLIFSGTPESPMKLYKAKDEKLVLDPIKLSEKDNRQLIFGDFNNDGFEDMYVVNGTYSSKDTNKQNDELWLNDKKEGLTFFSNIKDGINSQAAVALDIDKDNDLDIFIAGNISPFNYPNSEESILLINDGTGNFTITKLGKFGMITATLSLDINNDKYEDIIMVGEWMSPLYLENKKGKLMPPKPLLDNQEGWWNTIEKADLDNDGDFDLVLGNIGDNVRFLASQKEPANLYNYDIDQNGRNDFFMEYYINHTAYPPYSRDEVTEQIPSLKSKFLSYLSFSTATISDIFSKDQLKKADIKTIKSTKSLLLENSNGKFIVHDLPHQAQWSPVNAILITDLNNDNKKDLILAGNNDNYRLRMGKVFGNYGQVYLNNGNFKFSYIPQNRSGLYVDGKVTGIVRKNDIFIFTRTNQKPISYNLTN